MLDVARGAIVGAMNDLEKPLKALANRRRIAILRLLKKSRGERGESVADIAAGIHLSFKATSRHLAILAAADIVEREQRRLYVFYRIRETAPAVARAVIKLF
ncbi:MAG: hypothetical protein A2762_00170 [Candidatus Lloydbacteria bacterium RIFCSPHIGHO2_01_FULL_54_11]|nr:MAG: hypothetical protein A2762_00170 [Candidatus Lloydbacteria bacterium RIFCSPHIGHO2_01_FULL_54_11]